MIVFRGPLCVRGRLELHPGSSRRHWPLWCHGRRYAYVTPRAEPRIFEEAVATMVLQAPLCERRRLELHPGASRRRWPPWCYGRRYVNVGASSSTPEPRRGRGHHGASNVALCTWTPRAPPRGLEEAVAIMVLRTPLCERGRLELHPGASRRQWPLWCFGRSYVNVDASSSTPVARGGSGHYGATDAAMGTRTPRAPPRSLEEAVATMVLRAPLCERGRLELHPGASRRQWPLWCCGRRRVNTNASCSTPELRGCSGHYAATDAAIVNVDASSSTLGPPGGSVHSGATGAAMCTWTPRAPPRGLEEAVAIMELRTPPCERGRLELHPGVSRRQWPPLCYGRRYVNVDASSSTPEPRGGSGHSGVTGAAM